MGIAEVVIDTADYDLKIRALQSGMQSVGSRVIKETIDIMEDNLRIITPVRTGKLRDSIRSVVFGLTGEVSTNSGYGLFVDVDTKAHIIKGNPFLRFEIGNKVVFARQVFHPGTKGQKLRERTLKNSAEKIKDIIGQIYLEETRA